MATRDGPTKTPLGGALTSEMSHAAQQILLLPETAPRRCAPSKCSAAVHFSSATSEWETPQSFFDECDVEWHFTLDPCCTHQNAKCAKHYTPAENGLAQDWSKDRVWMNPPYGRAIGTWMKKA